MRTVRRVHEPPTRLRFGSEFALHGAEIDLAAATFATSDLIHVIHLLI